MTLLEPAAGDAVVVDQPDGFGSFDSFDVRVARSSSGLLRAFNRAGALDAADVHVAARLGRFGGELNEQVLLAAALAVRAPRLGHVCTDLSTVRRTIVVEGDVPVDLDALPWPDAIEWRALLVASPLVSEGDGAGDRPLRLMGNRLYLDRYWREERQVAADLVARAAMAATDVRAEVLAEGLSRLFAGEGDDVRQCRAADVALTRHLAVVAGGPGTGKTTTVAHILALLFEQAAVAQTDPPLVALAAPTGKAAARLEEAIHSEAVQLDVGDDVRAQLLAVSASTLHRLLGWKPGNRARFRHDRMNRLAHAVVIVDETSMVSLSLMARLLEAVQPSARLVLVGDPEQLASVEAGAVLGDIVGPSASGGDGNGAPSAPAISRSIGVLRRVHRFGGAIAALATAIQQGDAPAVISVLRGGHDDVQWIEVDLSGAGAADLTDVRAAVVAAGKAITDSARAGDGRAALEALSRFRLLCAHRRGPYGVSAWTAQVEAWLSASIPDFGTGGAWYAGRPLLFTENDYGLRLYNGDTGVVVSASGGGVRAVFERRGQLLELSPHRLGRVETVHAMTVHKAQGSQFDEVVLLLPDPKSQILTRELLYTAVTRARRRLVVAGTAESVGAAVQRPIARASGLRELLWGEER